MLDVLLFIIFFGIVLAIPVMGLLNQEKKHSGGRSLRETYGPGSSGSTDPS